MTEAIAPPGKMLLFRRLHTRLQNPVFPIQLQCPLYFGTTRYLNLIFWLL